MNANTSAWNGGGRALRFLFWLSYPLLIFFGLRFFEPRHLALLLGGFVLLRNIRSVKRFVAGRSRIDAVVFFSLLLFSAAVALSNDEFILRLYPVVVNLGSLALFAFSLVVPPSIVERIARLSEPDLSEAGVVYTRRVTCLWCVFFVFNASMAAYTVFYTSREFWALYNGLIAYLLMGALFAGEWCCRRHLRRDAAKER
ncbi:MAG: hypothetical protein LBM17_01755 [Candidatus Accumulibacter sp.]|jgi:uncharacterized membrane protein|nr:hypothetical protein [Accumulibacter sp.]